MVIFNYYFLKDLEDSTVIKQFCRYTSVFIMFVESHNWLYQTINFLYLTYVHVMLVLHYCTQLEEFRKKFGSF